MQRAASDEKTGHLEGGMDNAAFVAAADDVVLTFTPGQASNINNNNDSSKSYPQDKPTHNAAVAMPTQRKRDCRYGWGPLKPRWIQFMSNIKLFVFLAVVLCLAEGFAVNGIANAGLLHIEKQFGLTSTKSSLISSFQDVGALIVVLFVSFLGQRFCKPHWVAVGSGIMAVGSFLFIVPHLSTSAEQKAAAAQAGPSGLCELSPGDSGKNSTDSAGGVSSSSSSLSQYLGLFMVANMVHGIGFTPMFTLGTVYMDENAEHITAAVYVGMTYAAAGVGVALGFFTGGQLTEKFYVDFDSIDQSTLSFGPRDTQWVGAWWLGFIPSCIAFLLLVLPIYGFPKTLPSGEKKLEGYGSTSEEDKRAALVVIKDTFVLFFKAVKELILNPLFMLISLAAAAETLIISGVSTFAFKYLAEQFSLAFDLAGNILGGLILVGATGMLSGGLIIRLFRLEALGMTRLCVLLTLIATAFGFAILASCSENKLAGQEVPYPGEQSMSTVNYTSGCQGSCECEGLPFDPVCGSDNRVYYSPCHAGCIGVTNPGPMASYHNCSCVALGHNVSVTDDMATASRGRCHQSCDNVKIFLPCLFIMFFAVLLTTTPNSMALLRVVAPDSRPFALGFQWMLIRLLGTIPGPPVVGFVLDKTCLVWNTFGDGTVSCAMYSKRDMAVGVCIWWVVVNVIACLCYFVASMILTKHNKSVHLRQSS